MSVPLLFALFGGCAQPTSALVFETDGAHPSRIAADVPFEHDGLVRNAHVVAPPVGTPGPWPMVLLLHGHGGSADQLMGLGTVSPYVVWRDLAAAHGLLLVVPDGELGSDGAQGWNDCRADATANPASDDVGFLLALADWVAALTPADADDLWVSGTSNGAQMAFRLAQEVPERTAAIAPLVSQMAADSLCPDPDGSVPLLLIAGTDDPIVPYDGGDILGGRGELLSVEDTMGRWVDAAGADDTPVVTDLPNPSILDASTVTHFVHDGPVRVEHLKVVGGGHVEPSLAEHFSWLYELLVGKQNHDIEMATEVYEFFVQAGLP